MPEAAPPDAARILGALRRAVARACPAELASFREDLVQAAQLRLLEIDRRNEKTAPRSASYLWQVAYTTVVDEIRRLRRQQRLASAQPAEEPESAQSRPDLKQDIRACLADLLDARRAAVVLHLEGFSADEVASVLKVNQKRAENLAYRGMADLRACLEGKGHKP